MKPDLLLLDEVTSALDPELVAEVLDVIRELAAAGMTMVIATHEMGFARDIADRVCFLDAGTILEEGPPEQILSDPQDRGRASSSSGSSRPAGSSAGQRRSAGPRAASTKTLNSRSNAGRRGFGAFRVALDAEDEPAVGRLQPFDEVAGRAARPGVGDETRRQVRRSDGLVVIRVHAQDAAAGVGREEDPGEARAGCDAERMDLGRAASPARSLVTVDVLEERAAREGVDRLEAAAHAEDGDAARLGRRPRLVLERVPVRLRSSSSRGWAGRSDPGGGRRHR